MTKRISRALWGSSFKRILGTMARTATRAGARAVTKALALPKTRKPAKAAKPASSKNSNWAAGITVGVAGARRYCLYRPPGVRRTERLPLMVMLHGCLQDATALAATSKMNRLAASKRFLVLYPEQDKISNGNACWNWYETRLGKAQREARSIDAVIDQLCQSQPIDPQRIAVAGLSAGASMAALLALSHPERFKALAMHSGIATGLAHSSASAVMAMRGRKQDAAPLPTGLMLPALLVIQGSQDRVVAPANAVLIARQWAAQSGARVGQTRIVQRGTRYPATVTDFRSKGQVVVSLCEITGLDHAWSGGAAGHAYSDPKGPDASGMIWAFASKQFARLT
ncbi:extracellular catalytic domain type 1 short-chain-length polyhydroxyalkanoate depolymerase [Undibacterium umbellatum]|uniref:PHB depolymerase family esterase n=1 Tax=Undibacterium umbellatum TaxID=2762300 RepID=A0ABR6ZHN2_9BURK|nr:PHB depolymerase family esterase [Undibacterium umbellatum]MBC3911224.1 PHB depolymerase family esterase [Undibacterium umbellatum]